MPFTCRAVYVIGPDKRLKLSLLYPASTGRTVLPPLLTGSTATSAWYCPNSPRLRPRIGSPRGSRYTRCRRSESTCDLHQIHDELRRQHVLCTIAFWGVK